MGASSCFIFSLIDDDIPEDGEEFTFEIFAENVLDTVVTEGAFFTVIVQDNESESYQNC